MTSIHKYKLAATAEQILEMPPGARLLSVGEADGRLCLWALVENGPSTDRRRIIMHGPASPVKPETMARPHLGTVVLRSGFVWHVFDGGRQLTPEEMLRTETQTQTQTP